MVLPTHIYSVSDLVGEMQRLLESSYRNIWVEGEISNLATPASGHLYFSLKEHGAIIRCAFFRNRRRGSEMPKEGMQVVVRGQISIYPGRGDLQLIVSHLEAAGEGALRRAFEALKSRLADEGLFDSDRKKPLPAWPTGIGIVTSADGAALQDMLVTLKRRYPAARVVVYPVLVQGEQAADDISEMLDIVALRREVDVVILARGGGSLEDLQPFNEERVARAIDRCPIPLVSGVGHETDFTIADLVADQRGATPTAAATLVSPDARELLDAATQMHNRLVRNVERSLNILRQHIDITSSRLIHPTQRLIRMREQRERLEREIVRAARHQLLMKNLGVQRLQGHLCTLSPVNRLRQFRLRIEGQQHRMQSRARTVLENSRRSLTHIRATLQIMNPVHTLRRGYAILQQEDGEVVISTRQVHTNEVLTATLADGQLRVNVDKPVTKK